MKTRQIILFRLNLVRAYHGAWPNSFQRAVLGASLGMLISLGGCAFRTPVYREEAPPVATEAPKAISPPEVKLPGGDVVTDHPVQEEFLNTTQNATFQKFCSEVDGLYQKLWGTRSPCTDIPLKIYGQSVEGRPLTYFESGDPASKKLTVIECGIHGDELPAPPMCFRLIQEIISRTHDVPSGMRLIIQPLLNPDGMFRAKPSRANAHGVDINRNFPTLDFEKNAAAGWHAKEHGDPRKFPGDKSNSEPETKALVAFLQNNRPQKIISIHTPLGFLDLDAKGGELKEKRARFLALNMSKNSGNYSFKTFGIYPGSLGNYAGRERQIPVYTLELPSGNSKTSLDNYWARFRRALWRAIRFDLETGQFIED